MPKFLTRPSIAVFDRQMAQSPDGKFWDDPVVDASTQAPAGSTTPAAVNPDTTTQQVQQRPAGQPGADDAEAKRQRGILADLQTERTRRQELERKLAESDGRLTAEQKRVRALAGLDNPSSEEAEAEQIRARFYKVFPHLKGLSAEKIEKLLANADAGDSLAEATQHHWQTHGRQMLNSVVTELAEAIGGTLTERQQTAIKRAYAQAAEDPAFLKRHELGDPKLVSEFVAQWVEDWFEPARRQVTAAEAGRLRRVPNGRDRTITTGGTPKKIDFKDPKAVEDAMLESFKSHGGAFGE